MAGISYYLTALQSSCSESSFSPDRSKREVRESDTSRSNTLLFIAVSVIYICHVSLWEYLWPQIHPTVGCARDGNFETSAGTASMCGSVYARFFWTGKGLCTPCHIVTQPSAMQHLGVQIKSLFLQFLPLPSCPVGLLWHTLSVCAVCQSRLTAMGGQRGGR